jgi:large repetitive protein
VAKVTPSGSPLAYTLFIGGTPPYVGYGIAVDSEGSAYLAGGFGNTAFVKRLNPAGTGLISSIVLGGGSGAGIAIDGKGNAFLTGTTRSATFPLKHPLQPIYAGNGDAFVSKIDTRTVTTTTLSSLPNPSTFGQAVQFIAAVSSSRGAPPDGETVTFMKGTKTVLGTGILSGGSASFTTSSLAVGTSSITAFYAGDLNFGGSKSKAVSQVVN